NRHGLHGLRQRRARDRRAGARYRARTRVFQFPQGRRPARLAAAVALSQPLRSFPLSPGADPDAAGADRRVFHDRSDRARFLRDTLGAQGVAGAKVQNRTSTTSLWTLMM